MTGRDRVHDQLLKLSIYADYLSWVGQLVELVDLLSIPNLKSYFFMHQLIYLIFL